MTAGHAERPHLDPTALAEATADVPDLLVEVVPEAPSTNVLATDRARAGAPDGTVVVADHQSGGRGRLDRSWQTPPGTAVTFSVLLRPTVPTRSWPWLPLLAGYAVVKELTAMGYRAGVKWPNDVLIGGRKVAGILVERIETDQGPAAVVGIGLNVALDADELPVPTATSLLLERPDGAPEPDRTEVLARLLVGLREAVDTWQVGGDLAGMRLASSYAEACVTLGQDVRVELPGGRTLQGRAVEIDPTGQLVVADGGPAGERVHVGAGDVVHVR